jgi:hypothetical protein
LQQSHVHAAVTALVDSGVSSTDITSLANLVTIENFKRILRRRHEMVGGRENIFNHDLAGTLVEIARRWVKVDTVLLDELKRLAPAEFRPPSPALRTRIRQRFANSTIQPICGGCSSFRLGSGPKSNGTRGRPFERW